MVFNCISNIKSYVNNNNLINIREFFVSYFCVKILGIIKVNKLYQNKILLFILNLFPYIFSYYIMKLLNVYYLYKKDDIIYYSKSNKIKISPLLFDIYILNNLKEKINLKTIFSKYDNNVPLYLIFLNEKIKINDNDEIKIKFMKSGKILEKSFNFKKIKFNIKIDLFN